jgi:hypothetical protein
MNNMKRKEKKNRFNIKMNMNNRRRRRINKWTRKNTSYYEKTSEEGALK